MLPNAEKAWFYTIVFTNRNCNWRNKSSPLFFIFAFGVTKCMFAFTMPSSNCAFFGWNSCFSCRCKVKILLICMEAFCLEHINNHINIRLDIKNFPLNKRISWFQISQMCTAYQRAIFIVKAGILHSHSRIFLFPTGCSHSDTAYCQSSKQLCALGLFYCIFVWALLR